MKNPLKHRLKRDLRQDIGKYLALFLFLSATIGFISGFLVSDNSVKASYDDSFEKYNIEDGHFTLGEEADNDFIEKLESEDIKVYELYNVNLTAENDHSVRIYKHQTDINDVDVLYGELPKESNEIAIDRLYAENNGIDIGDSYVVDHKMYMVCGLTAFSNYSALFKNNTDSMFDANKFTVALVSDSEFERLYKNKVTYTYAWLNNSKLSEDEAHDKADDIREIVVQNASITDFVARENNQAIIFTGNDMGNDKAMMTWLLYIVIVIMAFIFGVTTKGTIEQEAGSIGTLRASGYTKGEMLKYYLTLPTLITLVAAIVGNVIGYTFMKNVCASMYYNSYSLPTYQTLWNGEAFIKTTVVPCIIILIVNMIMLKKMLSLSPLAFLRHDLRKSKMKRVSRLPNFNFIRRFRLRIIDQNKSAYITMFVGVAFASVLLMFGLMMLPLISQFHDTVTETQIANYQYILKAPVPTEVEKAEKYSLSSLENEKEEISVYGISENSKYLSQLMLSHKKNTVVISSGYAAKYNLKQGDTIVLHDKYEPTEYTFTIGGIYEYPPTLSIFVTLGNYNEIFNKKSDDFTGYFSNEKIEDIDENYVATVITEKELTVVADQMQDSIGKLMPLFAVFAILMFFIMIYLLAKIIIERNAQSISMLKILGYTNGEASRIYNRATAEIVVISLFVSLPISYLVIKQIYYAMMGDMNGWLTFWIAPWIYPAMIGMGATCYLIIHLIEMKKMRKIPMTQALKNIE